MNLLWQKRHLALSLNFVAPTVAAIDDPILYDVVARNDVSTSTWSVSTAVA